MLVVRSRWQSISPLSIACYSTKKSSRNKKNTSIPLNPNKVIGDPDIMQKTLDPNLLPDPQPEKPQINPMLDFVNTFGLGDVEGSSEWRDQKLYVRSANFCQNSFLRSLTR
jgi:hypothetical protein